MKKYLMLIAFIGVMSSSIASAQIVGGILCGIGVYCPPHVPANPPAPIPFAMLEGSSIGKTVPDYYSYRDYLHLSNMLKGGIRTATPLFGFGWEKSEYYYIVQSTFTVLKTGRRFDGLVPCLQYEHKIVVKERPTATIKGNIITQETIIENACSITPDYQILPSGFMFYLTEAKYIIFSKPK